MTDNTDIKVCEVVPSAVEDKTQREGQRMAFCFLKGVQEKLAKSGLFEQASGKDEEAGHVEVK